MLKSVMRSVIAISLFFTVASEAEAGVTIVPPSQSVAGHTQLYWAEAWWQWVLGIPAATNPLFDQTGAFAAINNKGSVFFLAGTSGGAVSRTITVPFGRPVFFPVINQFFIAINTKGEFDPSPCPTPLTLSCAQSLVTSVINKAKGMTVQIDKTINLNIGSSPKITTFRETSTSFFLVTLPQDNILGVDQSVPTRTYFPGNPVTVQDGYYIMLSNLSLGTHSLRFHAELPGPLPFRTDVTDTLNVVAP